MFAGGDLLVRLRRKRRKENGAPRFKIGGWLIFMRQCLGYMLPGVGSLPHDPEIVGCLQLVAAVVRRLDERKDREVVDKGLFVSRVMPQPRRHLCWVMFVLRVELRTSWACTISMCVRCVKQP
jgi:hypothetical protein